MVGVVSDNEKVERKELYEAMFRAHYHAVNSYVRGMWPSVDEDDVMSKTFETAWLRFDEIPPHATRGWLVSTAKNCALNGLRSARRRQTYLDAFKATRTRFTSGLHDEVVASETTDALQLAFGRLREGDQEVLLLASWDGLSGDDLGAALGCAGATAAVRLFRARERLRVQFAQFGGLL
jgi:RNA polymerase sigma factor (sigma-70 family)